VKRKLEELQEAIKSGEKEILQLAKEIDEFTKIRDAEMSGELMELEATLKEKEKNKAKVRNIIDISCLTVLFAKQRNFS
jgi:predicted RNase H-like nuclease (RuvC/YqgF family)